jgi:sugar lactone lactonase YvrE
MSIKNLWIIHFIILFSPFSITQAQTVSTLVNLNRGAIGDGIVVSPQGDIYYAEDYTKSTLFKITPDGDVTNFVTGLSGPTGAAIDSKGNIYTAGYPANLIYQISPDGKDSVILSGLNGPAGVAVNSNDELFITEFGSGVSGSGNRIIKLTPDGDMEIYASGNGLLGMVGIAVDDSNNLYTANWAAGDIYKTTPEQITTLFVHIQGRVNQICYSKGYLYVPSPNTRKIFRVSLAGDIEYIAGTGAAGYKDSSALYATFTLPNGIAANAAGDTLYLNDNGRVRMITGLDALTFIGSTESPGAPVQYELLQNYPNPFNPSTRITFRLPAASFVSLKVYNILGEMVDRLVEKELPSGTHTVTFNASQMASGIYFYKIQAENFFSVRKMIFAK